MRAVRAAGVQLKNLVTPHTHTPAESVAIQPTKHFERRTTDHGTVTVNTRPSQSQPQLCPCESGRV